MVSTSSAIKWETTRRLVGDGKLDAGRQVALARRRAAGHPRQRGAKPRGVERHQAGIARGQRVGGRVRIGGLDNGLHRSVVGHHDPAVATRRRRLGPAHDDRRVALIPQGRHRAHGLGREQRGVSEHDDRCAGTLRDAGCLRGRRGSIVFRRLLDDAHVLAHGVAQVDLGRRDHHDRIAVGFARGCHDVLDQRPPGDLM